MTFLIYIIFQLIRKNIIDTHGLIRDEVWVLLSSQDIELEGNYAHDNFIVLDLNVIKLNAGIQ